MSYTLTVINEDWVLPNANFKYVKSSGIVNLIEDFPLESKNYKKSNPTADVYVQFYVVNCFHFSVSLGYKTTRTAYSMCFSKL